MKGINHLTWGNIFGNLEKQFGTKKVLSKILKSSNSTIQTWNE